MFKRVERKRKRREEEEEMGLDEDTREIMGLNDTDSDESDSGSEQESDGSDTDTAGDEEEHAVSDPPLSIAEALKDPIYLISLDPTAHSCVLCKGKLIKNAGMATAHRNANVHKRRFEQFKLLSADADPRSDAWELVRVIQSTSNGQRVGSQDPSKRALKRQVKLAAIREKRKRHKELKAKAIAKKASKKLSETEETRPVAPPVAKLQCSAASQNQPVKTRKKQELESKISTSKSRKLASRTRTLNDDKKTRVKCTRKASKPS